MLVALLLACCCDGGHTASIAGMLSALLFASASLMLSLHLSACVGSVMFPLLTEGGSWFTSSAGA